MLHSADTLAVFLLLKCLPDAIIAITDPSLDYLNWKKKSSRINSSGSELIMWDQNLRPCPALMLNFILRYKMQKSKTLTLLTFYDAWMCVCTLL